MLPFTKDDVVAAYARHPSIKPLQRSFKSNTDKSPDECVGACCGLSILAIDAGHCEVVKGLGSSLEPGVTTIASTMKWSWMDEVSFLELVEFTKGFDAHQFSQADRRYEAYIDEASNNEAYITGRRAYEESMTAYRNRLALAYRNRLALV